MDVDIHPLALFHSVHKGSSSDFAYLYKEYITSSWLCPVPHFVSLILSWVSQIAPPPIFTSSPTASHHCAPCLGHKRCGTAIFCAVGILKGGGGGQ